MTGDNNLPGTNKCSFFQILPAMVSGSLLLMLIIIELMTLPEEFQVVLTFFQAFVLTLTVLRGLFQFVPMQIWEMPLRKLIYLEDG